MSTICQRLSAPLYRFCPFVREQLTVSYESDSGLCSLPSPHLLAPQSFSGCVGPAGSFTVAPGSAVAALRLACCAACGTYVPWPGWSPSPLNCRVNSYPLDGRGRSSAACLDCRSVPARLEAGASVLWPCSLQRRVGFLGLLSPVLINFRFSSSVPRKRLDRNLMRIELNLQIEVGRSDTLTVLNSPTQM